jgi:hypothetical protein
MAFSKETQELLKTAGWHPGRNVSGQYNLPITGYPALAVNFLNEYGNLTISGKKHTYTEVINSIEINPERGKGEYEEEESDYSYYSDIIKKKLFPLGFFMPAVYHICCDADGRVYMLGEYCYCRGKNLYEGIQNILLSDWSDCFEFREDTGVWQSKKGDFKELP